MLIVSPGALNRLTKTPALLPITTGGSFARTAGFAVSLSGSGSQTTRAVRCDQSRTPDIASRCGRKFEGLPTVIVEDVLAKLSTILE